ncbi:MAG: sigma 54-interacting transcriptional regulator [Negativicutes bacterium]|nr:sigma 54-interacting transcriptional regulator [Negativicutes bacterium]
MSIKIAIFSHPRMKKEMQAVWSEYSQSMTIHVVEEFLENALTSAIDLEETGDFDVYISAGANALLLRQKVSTPVVSIRITGLDLIRSIQLAKKYEGTMAVVSFQKSIPELQEIQGLMQLSVTHVTYSNEKELRDTIYHLKDIGITTVIGHSHACDVADNMGLHSVLIYTQESMRQAIENAYEVALSRRREIEKAERLKAILDYAYSGIIATDNRGEITVFNKEAEKILRVTADEAIGRRIENVIPETHIHNVIRTQHADLNQLQKIGDIHIITNRVPIRAHKELVGVVATFQDVTTIQKAEHKIRQDLLSKGLAAKFTFTDMQGESLALLSKLELAKKFAATESTVMITGETGTGKELLAQSIHNFSPRHNKPFVAVNCSAIPDTLLESELFGYEEGAFTGARRGGKAGLFELAHTGTIFLDEIGEIPRALQSRLLRVLQEREIMRVGSSRIIPVNVRVITATNSDLWQAVSSKKMREDLYYRLNVLHIQLPPLRDRHGDIGLLARHYVKKFTLGENNTLARCLPEILSYLESYAWPGNIRELQNVVERLAVLTNGSTIPAAQIKNYLTEMLNQTDKDTDNDKERKTFATTYSTPKDDPALIFRLLDETGGNRSEVARRLGISRMTLWRRLNTLGEDSPLHVQQSDTDT